MKKFLLGTVGLVALGMVTPASAADLAARPYTKAPPPVVAPIYDWTGFYVEGDSGVATQLDAGPRRFARIRKLDDGHVRPALTRA